MAAHRSVTPVVATVIAAAVAAGIATWWLPATPELGATGGMLFAVGFAGVFLGAQRTGFRLRWGEHSTRISMEEFTFVTGLLILPPHYLVAAVAASSIANQIFLGRPLVKAAFNVGQYTLAASAVVASFAGLVLAGFPPIWAAVPAAFVFSFVSHAATASLFARLEGVHPIRVFRERFLAWAIVGALLGVSLGLATYALWRLQPVVALAILPTFALMARFGRLSEWAEEEVRMHKELADAITQVAQTGDFEEGANAILAASGTALGAGEVRMRIELRPGVPETWTWKGPHGVGAAGLRVGIGTREGNSDEIDAFPRAGARAFGDREKKLLELVAASTASAARAHAAMLERSEANRRLTTANRELEEFTLWTTHDMREPLRSVGQLAQILHEEIDKLSPREVADLAERIHRGADGLKERIKALHEFSRVVQEDVPYETVDLAEVVDKAVADLAVRVRETGAIVETPAHLPVARVQQGRLVKVFANLIENALKYNDKTTPRIVVGAREGPEEIEFSVRDNGPGIESSMRERVFQLFQRGSARDGAGSGAGLAIVKRIVEQHGGRVWIEGPPGGGADFRFTLPIEVQGLDAPASSTR